MKNNAVYKLVVSALCLALCILLPFLTGQIPEVGNMLCPMHIPVLLCGFLCGAPWGAAVGFIAPLLRSLTIGMPVLFPNAVSMAFELCVYGFMTGFMHKLLPKRKLYIYVSLIVSMISGRLVWGFVQFMLLGFNTTEFPFSAFFAGAVTNAVPGIVLQIVLIPILVILTQKLEKNMKKSA